MAFVSDCVAGIYKGAIFAESVCSETKVKEDDSLLVRCNQVQLAKADLEREMKLPSSTDIGEAAQ